MRSSQDTRKVSVEKNTEKVSVEATLRLVSVPAEEHEETGNILGKAAVAMESSREVALVISSLKKDETHREAVVEKERSWEAAHVTRSLKKEKGKEKAQELTARPSAKERSWEASMEKEKVKRHKGTKNPAKLSPHELTEDTFFLKHPFVKLHKGMSGFPEQDRCGRDFLMDCKTLCAFQQFLAPSLTEYHEQYRMDGEELTARPAHAALLFEVGRLAKYLAGMKTNDDEDREGVNILVKGADEDDGDADSDVEEHTIKGQEDAPSVAWRSESSREGLSLAHESFSATASRPDFLAQGFDKAYTRSHQLERFHPDALCTFLVVEPKNYKIRKVWTHGPGGGFQAGSYAVTEAMKNLKKGRRKSIAVQGWSTDQWSYGELIVHGAVQVKDGEVFAVGEDGTLSARPDLDAIYLERKMELKNYLFEGDADFADGWYVAGDLYISNEICDFPTPERLSWPSHGSLRFLEGILHICLGKKILSWKKEDVESLLAEVMAGAEKIKERAYFGQEVWDGIHRAERLLR